MKIKGQAFYQEEFRKEDQIKQMQKQYPALFANGNNEEKLH